MSSSQCFSGAEAAEPYDAVAPLSYLGRGRGGTTRVLNPGALLGMGGFTGTFATNTVSDESLSSSGPNGDLENAADDFYFRDSGTDGNRTLRCYDPKRSRR
jgi:hypothetical protein